MPQQVSRHCWLRSRIVVENEAAKERGISSRTLKRAKAKLGVESEKTEDGWVWHRPEPESLDVFDDDTATEPTVP